MELKSPEVHKVVEEYKNRGYAPIPVPAQQKNPNRKGWHKEQVEKDDIARLWRNDTNTGLLTGEPSGWLVDIDIDVPEALEIAGRFLSPTLTSGRQGNPNSHWWYRAEGIDSFAWQDTDGKTLVEVRANGRQTLVPPSIHPTGEEYIWHDSGLEVVEVSAEDLLYDVKCLATATFIARRLPKHRVEGGGGRHDYALSLSGYLLRKMDKATVRKILIAAWDAKGWPSDNL